MWDDLMAINAARVATWNYYQISHWLGIKERDAIIDEYYRFAETGNKLIDIWHGKYTNFRIW